MYFSTNADAIMICGTKHTNDFHMEKICEEKEKEKGKVISEIDVIIIVRVRRHKCVACLECE